VMLTFSFFRKRSFRYKNDDEKSKRKHSFLKKRSFFYESIIFMFMYGHLNKHLTMLDIDLLLFCRLVLSLFDIPNIDKAIKQIYPQIKVFTVNIEIKGLGL